MKENGWMEFSTQATILSPFQIGKKRGENGNEKKSTILRPLYVLLLCAGLIT